MIALYLTIGLALLFVVIFMIIFIVGSQTGEKAPEVLTADMYMDEVNALSLADGDVARGEELVSETYECYVCHIEGAGRLAPDFAGIATRAETERPPLTAAAYLYESIFHPGVYQTDAADYQGLMPSNYMARLNDIDTRDMIAYLLTLTDSPQDE